MQTHTLIQGSPEWMAHRAKYKNASDAPVMLGCSPYKTRQQLLKEMSTGLTAEVDGATQARFDAGHRFEALARPLAEEIIGDDLAPVVASEGEYSASFDGLTLMGDVAFEHKTLNNELRNVLAPSFAAPDIPKHYRVQMEQQCMVAGCEKVLFMATQWAGSDLVEERHCWYWPDLALRAEIIAGWKQFAEDLAAYQPAEAAPAAVATVQPSLPAPVVRMDGALTVASNLPDFAVALRAYIDGIPKVPSSDQEFADCEAACKSLKKAEDALQQAEDGALAQMTDVEQMRRVVGDLRTLARTTRLASEKMVAARKEQIRTEIYEGGCKAYRDHVAGLNARLGKPYMPTLPVDFAGAIKNKRTVDSLRDAVSTHLATVKIAANEVADRIQINLDYLRENAKDHAFLFADTASIVLKAADDLAALVQSRIMAHQKAEADRLERERAAIAEQERVKAEARARAEKDEEDSLIASIWANARRIEGNRVGYVEKAIAYFEQGPGQFADDPRPRVAAAVADARAEMKMKLQAAKDHEAAESTRMDNERIAQEARDAIAVAAGVPAAAIAPAVVATAVSPMAAMSPKQVSGTLPAAAKPTLRLGAINERLGFIVNVNLIVHQLGIEPAETDTRNLPLFHDSQFGDICKALIQHIESVAEMAPA